jgi:hypothetical protein
LITRVEKDVSSTRHGVWANGAGLLVPDPEPVEGPQRRRYGATYEPRNVEEADACTQPGEVGAPLPREALDT